MAFRSLTNTYSFIKYVPVVIVMSVSHVSGYAMIRTGKGSEIPPIIEESVCGCLSVRGAEIPGYNCQIVTDKAITGNRYHDTPVRS